MLAADGEAYRNARIEQAWRNGVAASVDFDAGYRDVRVADRVDPVVRRRGRSRTTPREQATSGVLVDAIAAGRPVVATAFPHAVELLASGAGIVVDHDDPDALVVALRRILTEPGLAAEHGRRGIPARPEPGLAGRRGRLPRPGRSLLAERPALV